MKRSVVVPSAAVILSFFATSALTAASFPIAELGDCRDAKECRLYCEIPAHKAACWAYQTYQLADPAILGVTTSLLFPIADLDNCTSVKECQAYCDIPANLSACRAFGQKQGLTLAGTSFGPQTALLARAKENLGCVSLQQCRAYCNTDANIQQCQNLAKKFAPAAYQEAREALLEKAHSILHCDSLETCRAHCADPVNQTACKTFSQKHAPEQFRNRIRAAPPELKNQANPLPCATLADCQAYCSDPAHTTACAIAREGNKVKINVELEKKFTCNTKAQCERFCQANPDQCPSYTQSKDYERVKLQRQLRTQINLERFQKSLLEKPIISSFPAPTGAPAN